MAWASAHPWLTVLFVLPTLVGLPIALIKAIKGKQLTGGGASPAPNPSNISTVIWSPSPNDATRVSLTIMSTGGGIFQQDQPGSSVVAHFPDNSINVKVSAGMPGDGFNLTDGQVLHAIHPAGTA